MTTIVAMHTVGGGYIASDGRITGKNIVEENNTHKLLKYDDYIIGMSWLSALSQCVELYHAPISLSSEAEVYVLYNKIITILNEYGYSKKLKDFHMILLTWYGVYLYDWIENTFKKRDIFAAVWSGADMAYGYLHAYEDILELSTWDTSGKFLIHTLEECIEFVSRIDPYTNNHIISYSI